MTDDQLKIGVAAHLAKIKAQRFPEGLPAGIEAVVDELCFDAYLAGARMAEEILDNKRSRIILSGK